MAVCKSQNNFRFRPMIGNNLTSDTLAVLLDLDNAETKIFKIKLQWQ